MATIRREHRGTDRRTGDLPRPCQPSGHLLVPLRFPGAHGACRRPPRGSVRSGPMSALAPALQADFTNRLIDQRAASPNTISAYKHTFRLLLAFASKRTAKRPVTLDIADVD